MKIQLAQRIAEEFSVFDIREILERSDLQFDVTGETETHDGKISAVDIEMSFDVEKFRAALVDKLVHIQ